MKKIIYILCLTFTFIFSFSACENDIDLNDKNQSDVLIMNAIIYADSTTNYLTLKLTGKTETKKITGAKVEISINGELKETTTSYTSIYTIHTHFQPGNKVRIDATTADGYYHVYTEETIPYPIQAIDNIDTATVANNSQKKKTLQYKISFKDRPNENNYYRLLLQYNYALMLYNADTGSKTYNNYKNSRTKDYNCSTDVIMMDGHINGNADMSDYMPSLYDVDNKHKVFYDKRFANKSCTLTIYDTPSSPRFSNYYSSSLNNHITYTYSIDACFTLESITKNEYYYLKALNQYEDDNFFDDEDITGPMKFPSNVKGGAGFVGFCTSTSKIIRLDAGTFSE